LEMWAETRSRNYNMPVLWLSFCVPKFCIVKPHSVLNNSEWVNIPCMERYNIACCIMRIFKNLFNVYVIQILILQALKLK
jgi:hypothetical protein